MEIMHKGMWTGRRVLYLSVDAIRANPDQPRKYFEPEALRELAESIGRYGILQPLTVRRGEDGYELIAGERRLRAAKLAGLREVPCLAVRSDEEESALLSLIENLQRQDLHYMEEAAAIAKLIAVYGLSQEQAAERLGKSQSAVANKLRLLRLSDGEQEKIEENGLTERHARALLRLEDEEEREEVLSIIIKREMNVSRTEEYIEDLICAKSRLAERESKPKGSEQKRKLVIRDIRLFYNSIDHAVDVIKKSGIPVESTRKEVEEGVLISTLLPKKAS